VSTINSLAVAPSPSDEQLEVWSEASETVGFRQSICRLLHP
jgi:hypothetical protein